VTELARAGIGPGRDLAHLLALDAQAAAQDRALEHEREAVGEVAQPVALDLADHRPRRAVGLEEADHARLEHDRRGDVGVPAEHVGERVAAGRDRRLEVGLDEMRPAAAQHLALDERVVDAHRRLLQPRERDGGAVGIVGRVQRLGHERALLDAAEQHALEVQRGGRLGRAAVDDLADRAQLGQPPDGGAHAQQRVEAGAQRGGLGHRVGELRRRAHDRRAHGTPLELVPSPLRRTSSR
jgi:hypothetical protein